jgi:hypothetical protein
VPQITRPNATPFQALSLYKLINGAVSPKAFSTHPLAVAYGGTSERKLLDDIFALVEHEKGGVPGRTHQ